MDGYEMTSPHNFSLDRKTEALYPEFQELARKENKTVSELIREYIVDYVEVRNAITLKVEVEELVLKPQQFMYPMLTQKPRDPYPESEEARENWLKKYPRKVTVNYGK